MLFQRKLKMSTQQYKKLEDGPMDEIDAAVWTGDLFHNRANIAAFREMMARWERGLKMCEDILSEIPENE
jgi:hypothetical protein